MKCEEVRGLISEYIEEELSESLSSGVKQHCETCGECAAELKSFKNMLGMVSELREVGAPEGFQARVRDGIERRPVMVRWKKALPVLAAAATFVIGIYVGTRVADEPGPVYYVDDTGTVRQLRVMTEQPVVVLEDSDAEYTGKGGSATAEKAGRSGAAPVSAKWQGSIFR